MDALPQFERTRILLDADEQMRLASAHVLVAGLGGVGSYCAEALARAGVGRLTLIDVDVVVDCIDSLNCKVALVATSFERGLRVASSMGAGNKLDPTRIRIADISKTEMCPLAAVMRKRLRKRGIAKGVLTVFSDEPGRAPLPPQPVEGRGRDRAVNGTISYMPPLFGLMLAGAVVQRLIAAG